MDTFDMKPNHANGGEFKELSTRVPGVRFSEHLPRLAEFADQLAIVRGMSTREGDHQRGTYLMRTGQRPGTPIQFPCIGSSLCQQLENSRSGLPSYFSINPLTAIAPDAFSAGFLGPRYAPATVGGNQPNAAGGDTPAETFAELRVDNLTLPDGVDRNQLDARLQLWNSFQHDFLSKHDASTVQAQDTVYRRAIDLMRSEDLAVFDLSQESDATREAYGRGRFGQGCLLARRLIERGVPVVEVTLGDGLGWDTHQDNFTSVKRLSTVLDQGWSCLMEDLKQRGLLETTTILWMGEFGRTPNINNMTGRDHFPNAWTCVLAGGGIAGGQAYGKTSPDGMEVVDGLMHQGDLLATLCAALGVDPEHENISPQGRPHRITDGKIVTDLLA